MQHVVSQPYDLVIKKGNCIFQTHTLLMTNAQLKHVFKVFGKPIDDEIKDN